MRTHSEPGFKITMGKGFHITFANGWTASVQFGGGNYCGNRNDTLRAVFQEIVQSPDAEIAAWDKDGKWYDFGNDTVKGYCKPDMVLVFLNMIAAS